MSNSATSEKKVFISYCHDDNDEMLGDQWVEQFHRYLGVRLKQILGRGNQPDIWRDKELQGNQEFADVLVEELQRAAILISVLTPSYVESEWCQREIDEFVRSAEQQGGVKIGENQKRIFKVEKTPVDRSRHPSVLQGQTGYRFYIKDKEKGRPSELSLSPDDPRKNAIAKEVIEDLAHSIVKTLEAMKGLSSTDQPAQTDGGTEPIGASDEPKATVYLAETSFDIGDNRTKVRRELEAQGYRVLPEGSLPLTSPDEFEAAVRNGLDQCQLCIHMIGAEFAHSPAGHREDVVVLQNTIAADHDGNFSRLIWLPQDLSSDDESQQSFIDSVQRDPETHGNADVLQVPLHELITSIHDALKKLETANKQATTAGQDTPKADADVAPKKIYVCYSREDKDAAVAVLDHLFSCGFEVLEPLLDEKAEDQQVVDIHKANLGVCDATLLFVDQGGEYWLKTQISELLKAPHYRNNRPLVSSAIYLGPGMSNAGVRTHDLLLKASGEFSPETLAPFLQALGNSDGEAS
jgi:hypothetical protein